METTSLIPIFQLATIDYDNDRLLVFKDGIEFPPETTDNQITIGVFGREQIGKSTFLKALTNIDFKVGDDGDRTTTGILYGRNKVDIVNIQAFDAEGFGSDGVQADLYKRFKENYPGKTETELRQDADYLNQKACMKLCAALMSICDKIVIFCTVQDNFNALKVYFANFFALQTRQLAFAIRGVKNAKLEQTVKEKIFGAFKPDELDPQIADENW